MQTWYTSRTVELQIPPLIKCILKHFGYLSIFVCVAWSSSMAIWLLFWYNFQKIRTALHSHQTTSVELINNSNVNLLYPESTHTFTLVGESGEQVYVCWNNTEPLLWLLPLYRPLSIWFERNKQNSIKTMNRGDHLKGSINK